MTSGRRPISNGLDGEMGINADETARATRRAEALARMRKREGAILHAVEGGCPAPQPWTEVAIRSSPAHRPALSEAAIRADAAGPASREPGAAAERPRETRRPPSAPGGALDAADGAPYLTPGVTPFFPTLTFGFMTALLAGLMLAWLLAWIIVRFCL